jgi:hypothetical protein
VVTLTDLSKRIIISDSVSQTTDTILDSTSPPHLRLNTDILAQISTTLYGKQELIAESMALSKYMAQTLREGLADTNYHLQETLDAINTFNGKTDIPSINLSTVASPSVMSMMSFLPTTGVAPGISGYVNNIVGSASSGLDRAGNSIMGMASKFSPDALLSNPLGAIASLAKLLLCPERTFLSDITNAFNSIASGYNNFNPSSLLNTAMGDLSQFLNNYVPGFSPLMSFVSLLSRYLKTGGSDIDSAMSMVDQILNGNQLDRSYLLNISQLQALKDQLSPSSPYYQSSTSKITTPLALPQAIDRTRCSELAKVIKQLLDTYRADNRFEDVQLRTDLLSSIKDPVLANKVSKYMDASVKWSQDQKKKDLVDSMGYQNTTALNSALAVSMVNAQTINNTKQELKAVNGDPDKLSVAQVNANNNLPYIQTVNNQSIQDLKSFEEGIDSITRTANVYNMSKVYV